jgi:hypothetical protein
MTRTTGKTSKVFIHCHLYLEESGKIKHVLMDIEAD